MGVAAGVADAAADQDGRTAGVAARAAGGVAAGRRAAERGRQAAARRGQWAYAGLMSYEPPGVPVTEPWRLSVGTLVGRHPRTPGVARKILGLLDRFGAVRIGPAAVGFDADDVEWDKVLEIRTRTAYETLATVVLAALEQGSAEHLGGLTVPSEIVYKGLFGRTRTLSGGLFAVAVLAVKQQAGQSLLATAVQHGVPVKPAELIGDASQAARVASLRDRTAAISQRLRGLEEVEPGEEPADPPALPADAAPSYGSGEGPESGPPVPLGPVPDADEPMGGPRP